MTTTKPALGGWLAVFLFFLGIILPFRSLRSAIGRFSPEMGALFPGTGKLVLLIGGLMDLLIAIALFTAAVLMLVRRKWGSVRATIVILWVAVAARLIHLVFTLSWMSENAPGLALPTIAAALLQLPLFALVATLYLRKSERVAQTYAKPGTEAAVFS